jgi:hypothetical protein
MLFSPSDHPKLSRHPRPGKSRKGGRHHLFVDLAMVRHFILDGKENADVSDFGSDRCIRGRNYALLWYSHGPEDLGMEKTGMWVTAVTKMEVRPCCRKGTIKSLVQKRSDLATEEQSGLGSYCKMFTHDRLCRH